MEAIVARQGREHCDKMGMRPALEVLRSEVGEAMVLQNNYFIEEILPNAVLRKLSAEEMAEYRRPVAEPGEGRRPTLTWPRQILIEGKPADVHAIATEYAVRFARRNWEGHRRLDGNVGTGPRGRQDGRGDWFHHIRPMPLPTDRSASSRTTSACSIGSRNSEFCAPSLYGRRRRRSELLRSGNRV
jgi:hypothetical protein